MCRGHEHAVRWRDGERLEHLFEDRCGRVRASGRDVQLAVDVDGAALTNGQLDARANQLARHLLRRGARPGDRIGLGRAPHYDVAMQAALKVNAVYVPLDVGFPTDRLSHIVQDTGGRLVLSLSHVPDRLRHVTATGPLHRRSGSGCRRRGGPPSHRPGKASSGIGARRVTKALFDRAVALALVVLFLPLLVALGLAVRLTSRGPAIFTQVRVGRDGGTFRMYKFRSMYVDAEARLAQVRHRNESDGLLFKMRDDPRVTKVGKFLRKWSLDELPQLFNVLNGSMSLVGPRPPLPAEAAQYSGDVHRRLTVKPGLTGLWQISGRSDLEWDESVRLDLRYVEDWSLAMDFVILWRTVPVVLRHEGAY